MYMYVIKSQTKRLTEVDYLREEIEIHQTEREREINLYTSK